MQRVSQDFKELFEAVVVHAVPLLELSVRQPRQMVLPREGGHVAPLATLWTLPSAVESGQHSHYTSSLHGDGDFMHARSLLDALLFPPRLHVRVG